MAVREFDGVDDDLETSIGGLTNWNFGTVAVIVKPAILTGGRVLVCLTTSGIVTRLIINLNGTSIGYFDGSSFNTSASGIVDTTDWWLIVVRKASGVVQPRFSVYEFATDTWVHGSTPADGNSASPGAGGLTFWSNDGGSDFWNGRVAIRAVWANELGPSGAWTADASGDAAIEAAGLETSLSSWEAASPAAGWAYNQDSTATAVTDFTGGGADQTSLTGTTVINGDDPPGFSFNGAAETVTLAGTLPALTGSATIDASADAQLSGTLPALTAAFTVQAEAGVDLAGTLPALTGSFTIDEIAPPPSGIFVLDTFTDANQTLLQDHTPDVGGTWQPLDIGTPDTVNAQINQNQLITGNPSASTRVYRDTTIPPAAEYDVSAVWTIANVTSPFHRWAIYARMRPIGTEPIDVDYYSVHYTWDESIGPFYALIRHVTAQPGIIDHLIIDETGNTVTIELKIRDGSQRVLRNGVEILAATDTQITQVGRVGVSAPADTDNRIDNLIASTPSENVVIAGTLPALIGNFSVAAEADMQLAGVLPALTGLFTVAASSDVTLAGVLPALTGSFTIVAVGEPSAPIVLPPYREQVTAAYREPAIPAYQEAV